MNGTASQSSEYGRDLIPASNGIDGDTKWPNCSHTAKEMNSYLQTDLSKNAEIFEITIFKRVDQEVTKRRLKRFSISIGKTETQFKICATNENMANDISKRFTCHQVGRFVKIQLHIKEFLHICEVVILGRYLTEN